MIQQYLILLFPLHGYVHLRTSARTEWKQESTHAWRLRYELRNVIFHLIHAQLTDTWNFPRDTIVNLQQGYSGEKEKRMHVHKFKPITNAGSSPRSEKEEWNLKRASCYKYCWYIKGGLPAVLEAPGGSDPQIGPKERSMHRVVRATRLVIQCGDHASSSQRSAAFVSSEYQTCSRQLTLSQPVMGMPLSIEARCLCFLAGAGARDIGCLPSTYPLIPTWFACVRFLELHWQHSLAQSQRPLCSRVIPFNTCRYNRGTRILGKHSINWFPSGRRKYNTVLKGYVRNRFAVSDPVERYPLSPQDDLHSKLS